MRGGASRGLQTLVGILAVVAVACAASFALRVADSVDRATSPPPPPAGAPDAPPTPPTAPTQPTSQPTSQPTTQPTSGPGERIDALLAAVREVSVRPQVPGYERDCGPGEGCVFGTEWSDDTAAPQGHNGCDTRNDVLAVSLVEVAFDPDSPGCDVVAGRLVDPYTATTIDYATAGSQIHVDHLFPLAAAWDLGAAAWSPAERAAFANDTALELVAVQGTANLAKGDSTPASWLPPYRPYRCEYVARYLEVAVAYDLAITAADRTVIGGVRRRC